MANMIGLAFAAGFFDLDELKDIAGAVAGRVHQLPGWAKAGLPPELQALSVLGGLTAADLRFYETTFLAMQKRIFIDQGGSLSSVEQPGGAPSHPGASHHAGEVPGERGQWSSAVVPPGPQVRSLCA